LDFTVFETIFIFLKITIETINNEATVLSEIT